MKDGQIFHFPAVPETGKGMPGIPKAIKNIDGVKYYTEKQIKLIRRTVGNKADADLAKVINDNYYFSF